MFGLIGVPMGFLGFLIAAYLSYERLFGHESIANRPLLLLARAADFLGHPARHDGSARGNHGAHVPRVAGQADLRDSGSLRVPAAGTAPAFIERLGGQRSSFFGRARIRRAVAPAHRTSRMWRSPSPSTATTMARRQERCGAFSATAWGRRIFERTPHASRARRGRARRASSRCSTRGFRTPVRAKRRCRRSKGSPSRAEPQMRQRVDAVRRELDTGRPFEFSDCAIGNLVFAGCYLSARPPVQRRGRRLLRASRASGGPHRQRHRRHERVSRGARARSRRARERSRDRRRETAKPDL